MQNEDRDVRPERTTSAGVRRPGRWFPPLLALQALAPGCTSNQPIMLSPGPEPLATYLARERPSDLRVATASGTVVWLHNPLLVSDSLVGDAGRDQPPPRRAIAIADIRSLAVPRFSTARTVGLVGGVVGAAGVAILIVAGSGSEPVY